MAEKNTDIGFYCSSKSFGGLEINIIRIVSWLKIHEVFFKLFLVENSPIAKFAEENDLDVTYIEHQKKYFDVLHAKKLSTILKVYGVKILFVGATRDVAFTALLKNYFYPKLKLVYHQQMQLGIVKKDLIHTIRFNRLDRWIAPLPYLAREIETHTRFKSKRIRIIPLCIDSKQFSRVKLEKEEARNRLKLPPDKIILGILGRIDSSKGQDFLIKAIHHLNKKGYDIDLLIMGEQTRNDGDEYFDLVKNLIHTFELKKNVHIRPFSKDTLPFFKAIDIFAMTTKKETFGMVTVEAMASGVPVIAANSGGSIEILEHGKLGQLYTPMNLPDFLEKITEMLNNMHRVRQIAENAKMIAVEKYDKSVECKGFKTLISELKS